MPKPCSPMGILGSSNNYVIRDPHPQLSKEALPQLDQSPPGSHRSLETDGPPRRWARFNSEQESWKLLEVIIPSLEESRDGYQQEFDPNPIPSSCSPSRPWAGFNLEEELWEFLKTVIPNDSKERSHLRVRTSPMPNHQTGQDSRNHHTGNIEQLNLSEQGNQSMKRTQ